jgi:hypothetical protein
MTAKYSAFDKGKRAGPDFAAKVSDVTDENYSQRAESHARAWDRCATLHRDDPNLGDWLVYLEKYAPKRHKLALDAIAKRGYYTFPDRHPSDFDIRFKAEERPF